MLLVVEQEARFVAGQMLLAAHRWMKVRMPPCYFSGLCQSVMTESEVSQFAARQRRMLIEGCMLAGAKHYPQAEKLLFGSES